MSACSNKRSYMLVFFHDRHFLALILNENIDIKLSSIPVPATEASDPVCNRFIGKPYFALKGAR